MRFAIAAIVLVGLVAAAQASAVSHLEVVQSKPLQKDWLCSPCVSFFSQETNNLLNVILQGGVIGGCSDLCGHLNGSVVQTVCNLLCDVVGIEGFIHLLQNIEFDFIYPCQLLHVCPVNDCTAATCAKFTGAQVQPPKGPQGSTFNIEASFSILNATGTGEIVVGIVDPSGAAIGDAVLVPDGFQVGDASVKFQLQAQPSEDEPFAPGTYQVELILQEGQYGSDKYPHTRTLASTTTTFVITE